MKRKLAFVVQRYGLEVNGGAELLSRQLVEHLQQQYDIEVLTTKAIEYTTWKNEYTNDVDVINGVTVRRFGVDKPRDLNRFGKFSGKVIGNPEHTMEQEEQWFEMQGPHVPELIDYIKDHADDYEAFIFKNQHSFGCSAGHDSASDGTRTYAALSGRQSTHRGSCRRCLVAHDLKGKNRNCGA